MLKYRKYLILTPITLFFISFGGELFCQNKIVYDSIYITSVQDTINNYIRKHPRRFIDKEDIFNIIPYYGVNFSQERKFEGSGGFIAYYRTGPDKTVPYSLLSVIGSLSTNLSINGGIKGSLYSPYGKFLFNYTLKYNHNPRKFWGIGYDNNRDDSNKGSYKEDGVKVRFDFLYRNKSKFLIGPIIGFDYISTNTFTNPELIEGNNLFTRSLNAGLKINFDTRDNYLTPEKGVLIEVEQLIYFGLFEIKPYYKTTALVDLYFPVWKGGVIAIDVYGDFNYGDSPWTMWPLMGGDTRMRGYYQGRYRDKNLISAQLELRQNIYKGHGIAVWGGAGNMFNSFEKFNIKQTLPTYGAGYRFKFGNILFRADVGFGNMNNYSIIVGVNHAF